MPVSSSRLPGQHRHNTMLSVEEYMFEGYACPGNKKRLWDTEGNSA